MAFVFHRRLALPLWVLVFVAVAQTAPPPATLPLMPPVTLFVTAAVGIAAILFSTRVRSRGCARPAPSSVHLRTEAAQVRQT